MTIWDTVLRPFVNGVIGQGALPGGVHRAACFTDSASATGILDDLIDCSHIQNIRNLIPCFKRKIPSR